jgi:flagellin
MPLRVNNNIAAINSRRHLNANNRILGQRLERLASGLRINRAADDAAGLSVREGMRAELAGLRISATNAEQATNLIQTAEGSLNEINAIMIRMRELATQSANSTLTDQNRESVQAEFSQMTQEIDRIAAATSYNNQTLLTGFGNTVSSGSSLFTNTTGVTDVKVSGAQAGTYTFVDLGGAAATDDSQITLGNGTVTQTISIGTILDGNVVATGTQAVANFDRLGLQVTLAGAGVSTTEGSYADGDLNTETIIIDEATGGSFQVGPTDSAFNRIEVSVKDMSATGVNLSLDNASLGSITTARSSITVIDQAITVVAQQRGDLGAFQNRLSFAIAYTENEIENIQASEASISDADIAAEVTSFTRAQILSQAATAMLAQASVLPQNALALLQ